MILLVRGADVVCRVKITCTHSSFIVKVVEKKIIYYDLVIGYFHKATTLIIVHLHIFLHIWFKVVWNV